MEIKKNVSVTTNSERWFDLTPLLNEKFKDIQNYEGLYQISNYGRVKSLRRLSRGRNGKYKIIKEKILKVSSQTNKYPNVGLIKENKLKTFEVHRLVAMYFIPNPHHYPCVNHKDEDKTNNKIDNLEWCTYSYNNAYNDKAKKINEKFKKSVLKFDAHGNLLAEYNSITEASLKNKRSKTLISKYCNGKIKQPKKYLWEFKESES